MGDKERERGGARREIGTASLQRMQLSYLQDLQESIKICG